MLGEGLGVRTLQIAEHLNIGYSERSRVRFTVDSSSHWDLHIDDEPLQREGGQTRNSWIWEPNFFAGTVRGELIPMIGGASVRYLLDVTPDPRKLGQQEFGKIVSDLLDRRPEAILGHEPGTARIGRSEKVGHPSLCYAALYQYANPLLAALEQVRRRPRTCLQSTRRTVSPGSVRRVDQNTIRVMARNGALAALEAAEAPNANTLNFVLDVPYSRISLDAPATQCIVAMILAVIARCNRLVIELAALADKEELSHFSTSLRGRLSVRRSRINALSCQLKELLQRDPFNAVRRPQVSAAGLTAIAADPVYAQSCRLLWRILRPGVGGTDANQWAYMSPTWDIYEQWCLLRIRDALHGIFPDLNWSKLGGVGFSEGWIGASERGRVELRSQFTATAWDGESDRVFGSISKELRPDFHLSIDIDGNKRWLTFDAKYSQSRAAVLHAMQAAHVYHDALRLSGTTSRGCYLLVPAVDPSLAHLEKSNFQRQFGVGVLVCSPDEDNGVNFKTRLQALIDD